MGHRDGRMVERVYGKMTTDMAGTLIAKHLGEKWVGSGINSARSAAFNALGALPSDNQPLETTTSSVPRAGIEPATRGFSVPP